MSSSPQRPQSATSLTINTTALLVTLLTLWWLITSGDRIEPQPAAFLLILSFAVPIVVLEAIWLPRLESLPITPPADNIGPTWARVCTKLFGLAITLGLVCAVYWLLPEYRGAFYDRYYSALHDLAPIFGLMAAPYVIWMDQRSAGAKDGYWHLGRVFLPWLNGDDTQGKIIGQHLLGWLVKLFFLPLMYIYLIDKIDFYRAYDFVNVFNSFKAFYDFAFQSLFFVDLLIASVGYVMTFKASDSHIRSTEPTLLGWTVALLCYQPFWSFVSAQYLDYGTGQQWGHWFWDHTSLYVGWGSAILVLTAIYAWCTLCFGIRFSNLTHRGILTNGPYRFTKHPAYVSKNLSWWLISMPFMLNVSTAESLRHCLLLLALNGIYFLRARTEERHLSWDPVYRDYARYIEHQGMFRQLGHWIPALRFAEGKLFNFSGATKNPSKEQDAT